jgi:hypothetical protein
VSAIHVLNSETRPVSPRQRRRLARQLHRTARQRPSRDPIRRRYEVLLTERVIAVAPDLRAIAATLEQIDDSDPEAVAAVRRLLSDGRDSPLYNPDIHPSELRATLYYVHAALRRCRDRSVAGPAAIGDPPRTGTPRDDRPRRKR